ncbi:MAG: hypothetical protein NC347_14555 [Clostridium sp.]|nr:hypothetical protein [Clostridium sp.]
MDNIILEQINDLFDSYDLFGGSGMKRIRDNVKKKIPDIGEEYIKELEDYLNGFYNYCIKFGELLADKYKTPFLPGNEQAQKEIAEYVIECQRQYPEIDEEHIVGVFSNVCWLANR